MNLSSIPSDPATVTRRHFLKVSAIAGGGMLIGFQSAEAATAEAMAAATGPFAPNPFLRITPDGIVTVIAKHSEMGQGAYTSIAMCVAEELDADWTKVKVEAA